MYLFAAARARLRRPARLLAPPAWEALAVAGYLAALVVAVGRMASARLFWFDELFTLQLARFDSPAELWQNLAAGADNNPPVVYLLTAAVVAVFGEAEWAVRLPAIAGAVLAGLCLYLFVRRRRGACEGLLALTALGTTAPVWCYFLEARPYGLMIGLTALALLCWQRAADPDTRRPGWLAGFAAAAVLGMGTHYYFVVPLAGLAAAEAVRVFDRRTLDRPLLAGFVAAGLTLAACYPLWGATPKVYGPGFWAKVKFNRPAVEDAFQGLYAKEVVIPVVLGLAAGVVAGAVAPLSPRLCGGRGAGVRGADYEDPLTPAPLPRSGGEGNHYPLREAVALVALAAGPAIGVFVGAKLVGGYHYRYTVPAAVGLAGLLAFAVGRAAGSATWGCLVAAAAFAVAGPAGQWKDGPAHFRAEAAALHATADFLDTHAAGGTVVVESAFEFTRLWHYHPDRQFAPAFLADPELARRHTKVDTIDRGLVSLGRAAAVPVVGFDDVERRLAAGEPTYFYGGRLGVGCPDGEADDGVDARGVRARWQPWELAARGVRFEPVARRGNGTLYRLKL